MKGVARREVQKLSQGVLHAAAEDDIVAEEPLEIRAQGETLAVTMYREGFILFNQGYGAAIAVIIGIAAMIFSYFYLRSVLDQEKQV